MHATFPSDECDGDTRLREARVATCALRDFVDARQLQHCAVFVVGDMNGTAADPVLQHIFGLVDRVTRLA